jgi:hypothetical protein
MISSLLRSPCFGFFMPQILELYLDLFRPQKPFPVEIPDYMAVE